ncbi:LysR family transcriptional regulator [Nitrosomonas oligotropha]|uniref:LysR family transcriptional regulator, regulator for metE and metH n=1 Tax=Nitrosomonas oligotropha TaxID=42354 RepID=A0A1H8KLM2_9PROT|nr:LysR family transcriptional regulator [Nitrosomonas oligotropha]SDW33027.1 LysR family transcriptional regulator, regulator for metE and metH [Nitrosomonas oligotropha]SEN93621.1 LysR family transcriptional regulator, regulator for metE and metH [Nitrosomonas oligotropha]
MIEHSHLKIIQALHTNGTLTEAANTLCLSQPALSHQIGYLEKKLGVKLWEREGRSLRLTQAGLLLLETAQQVLPVLAQAEKTLVAYGEGRQGILRIGVECYPCFEWLTGMIGQYMRQMPGIDVDIVQKFQFSGLEGLLNQHIDVLITPDWVKKEKIDYEILAEYQLVLLVSVDHPLADTRFVTPELLCKETLLTFPVPLERLDILTHFLTPAHLEPEKLKQIESLEIMLQMTALNRGVCVLPEWLADIKNKDLQLKKIQIGDQGLFQKLYLAMREADNTVSYIRQFIGVGQKAAKNPIIQKFE